MKTSTVSSQAISSAIRYQMMRMQSDLVKAQQESVSGRVADVGLHLGVRTGQSVSMNRDVQRLNGLVDTNSLAASRLSATQDALKQMSEQAQTLLSTLTSSVSGDASATVLQEEGAATLQALTALVNTSFDGEYIFAGINTDVKPINDFGPGSPAKAALDAAFAGHFGFAKNDPAAAGITTDQMSTFITDVVEPMFMGTGWDDWSNASDQTITSRIALNETAQTSVSANEAGIRKLALASVLSADLLQDSQIGDAARSAIASRSVEIVGEAVANLAVTQSTAGIAEQRISKASERLTAQIDLFERHVQDMEGVDPYEAATRVSDLLAQIELSYSLTARIQQLSLVNYLT